MRQARLKAPSHFPVAYYHCVSRVVDRRFVILAEEREQFVHFLRMYETLCQVRVVTFCVLSNHFHVIVEVPRRPDTPPTDAEVLRVVRRAFGKNVAGQIQAEIDLYRKIKAHDAANAILDGFRERMWDISAFMKSLKQRFTQWFNKKHQRKGTLWEERYKSTLIEGGGDALAMCAAYVDLNPVRAKLVSDPKDYRWCGYAQAVGGSKTARQGLEVAVRARLRESLRHVSSAELLERYRVMLFTWGTAVKTNADGTPRGRISEAARERVEKAKGRLSVAEALRCRVRYFTDGAVLGTREFVNAMFKAQRRRYGSKRQDGARRMRRIDHGGDAEICSMRDLKVDVITSPAIGQR
ncbi:MAG: transposase [Verrucomicrobiaceae bacterium]|nr:transposase [Verrucomicrobiaceae bacterium]